MYAVALPAVSLVSSTDDSSGGRTWAIALFFGIALGIFIKVAQKRASRKQ